VATLVIIHETRATNAKRESWGARVWNPGKLGKDREQPVGFIIWDRLRGTIEVTVIFLDFATIV